MEEDIALSVEEARKFLKLGRTKFYSLLSSNQIRAKKLGRRTIVLRSTLEKFLAELEDYSPQKGEQDNV